MLSKLKEIQRSFNLWNQQDADWPTQANDIMWLIENHDHTYWYANMKLETESPVNDLATCVFQTSDGVITLNVSLQDAPKLINTVIAKTHWQLKTINIPERSTTIET